MHRQHLEFRHHRYMLLIFLSFGTFLLLFNPFPLPAQFCQDFSLKSTALLTATQLGDIYLSIVPLQSSASLQAESRYDNVMQCYYGILS